MLCTSRVGPCVHGPVSGFTVLPDTGVDRLRGLTHSRVTAIYRPEVVPAFRPTILRAYETMNDKPGMTLERLQAFDDAWARKDLDSLMEFVTDDCEYHASVGPEPGRRYVGKEQVRDGFREMLEHDAGSEPQPGRLYVYGDRGVAEWSYVCRNKAGDSTLVRGCDLFEFEGDKIRLKNAFRKCTS